jgi:hypothetical protein
VAINAAAAKLGASTDASKKECMMSNESNREARTISPSELQASDFFPPGHGWNKDEECSIEAGSGESAARKPQSERRDEDGFAIDGGRPH